MPRNGITLMTLIITIVIMLIIAGVTIGITADGDGLADKAQEQVNKTNNRIAKDQEATQGIIDEIKDELKVDVSGVVLDTTNVTLKIGDTKTITATVVPQNSPNKAITWTSSDSSVVTVNNGLITAIKTGTAIITVTTQEGNESASCSVTVIEGKVSVETVEITPTEITIPRRSTSILTATITPENATNKNATWSSSDSQVATVDSNGIVTAVNGGIAVITVTTQDGGKTASCTVKVNPFDTTKVPDVVIESSTIAGVNKQRIAPIPAGYTASKVSTEDEISEGLVIYQTSTAVTGEPNSDAHKTAMEGINQYVWIPVDDINDMVMCKYNNKTTKIDGTAIEDGICELEYDVETNEIICKTHGFDTTGYDTTANVLAKTNLDTVGLAGRLYGKDSTTTDTSAPYICTTSMDFTTTSQTFSANSGYREPAIVTGKSSGTGTSYDGAESNLTGIADGTVATFKAQLNKDFIAMAKSVAKYGGFYVSRYEAGEDGASLKNQKVLVAGTSTATNHNPDTYINGNKWYGMYNTLMSSTAIDKTAVNSHMIWGCQYDQIIKFLSENSINEPQIAHIARQLNAQKLTGETTTDIMSNIYDLEGNNVEWTAQAYAAYYRIHRGGNFYNVVSYGGFYPASHRLDVNPTFTDCYYASRSVLYVK